MSEVRDILSKPVNDSQVNHLPAESYARIIRSNEKENACDILYADSYNRARRKKNVEVKIYGNNDSWFPKPGDLVHITGSDSMEPLITGPLIRDYIRDLKEKHTYKKDVLHNNKCLVRNGINP